jgi:hypothetical protein
METEMKSDEMRRMPSSVWVMAVIPALAY